VIKFKTKLFLILLCCTRLLSSRSIYRVLDPKIPSVTIYASNKPDQKFILTDSHIKMFPLFEAYNEQYLNRKKLPKSPITYRNKPNLSCTGKKLSDQLEKLLTEIASGKNEFTDFKILKKRDFNFRTKCGLIVLKFKDAPFVAKLFIEAPRSLARPYSKGILPMGMFVMGGTNRHLNGFTRIKNMENIKAEIEKNPAWRDYLSVPRKWFWTPKETVWLHVIGQNVGGHKHLETRFPATYAVIADEIIPLENQPPSTSKRNLPLCQELDFKVDPNHNNFIIEKDTNKLVMYDTEHFPTLIGEYFEPLKKTTTYVGWYVHLARKFLRERIFANKDYQRRRQQPGSIYPLY
jgi:hypothetical protein